MIPRPWASVLIGARKEWKISLWTAAVATPSAYPIDSELFKSLYQEYQSFVYRRAYSMLGDSVSAEDVTQNTFIKVYRNIHSFRGGEFRIWLFRIVTNACYDELRRRKLLHACALSRLMRKQMITIMVKT